MMSDPRHCGARLRPVPPPQETAPSERLVAALAVATRTHRAQRRPGTEIPFLAHLLVVCGLVIEDGGSEDEAIAALLHDAVDDGGGGGMLREIRTRFGPRVADIVAACSDLPAVWGDRWIDRKRRYLGHLSSVDDDAVLRVALADKVHNARSIVRGLREEGDSLWERFGHRTAAEQVEYYRGLLAFFEQRRPGPLARDLRRALDEMETLLQPAAGGE